MFSELITKYGFGNYSTIGCGNVLLPGAVLEEGACVGAMSLIKDVIPVYKIYAGVPAHKIGDRSKKC